MTSLLSFLRDLWWLATQHHRRRKWERAIKRKAQREMAIARKGVRQ